MDDFAFKTPGKILKFLLMGAFLISATWGVITWDSQKAMNLWTTQVTFITKPVFNFFAKRFERRMEAVTEVTLSGINKEATTTQP